MSNTLIIDSLNTLFSMSNTAVIGAQEQFVAFMNPAAQELFRGNRTNHKLTELLPAHITEATATGIRHVCHDRKAPRHHLRDIVWCVSPVLVRAAG